jgi:hypothetical protein
VEAVVGMFEQLGGAQWLRSRNWGIGHPCENEWEGITCCPIHNPNCLVEHRRLLADVAASSGPQSQSDPHSGSSAALLPSEPFCRLANGFCVIANINLQSNNVKGTFDTSNPFLSGALAYVQELDLSNNSLTGPLLDTAALRAMPRLRYIATDQPLVAS